jgi:hypothetical protein
VRCARTLTLPSLEPETSRDPKAREDAMKMLNKCSTILVKIKYIKFSGSCKTLMGYIGDVNKCTVARVVRPKGKKC